MHKIFLSLFLVATLLPTVALAHQPRVVESRTTVVTEPEISKAYYGELTGVPDTFTFTATTSFNLYVNVLVPDTVGQTKDVTATITKDGALLATLDGPSFTWTKMFEPFGYDTYWKGPEYRATSTPGTYVVTVTSIGNTSKYSLAIGEIESFNAQEILNTLTLVPQLKQTFFDKSPIYFIFSPFGWGLILILYALAALFGLGYRFALKFLATDVPRSAGKNIGTWDRAIRFAIGIALLLWAITTTWNPILIFISGFTLFESLFSWCILYSAMGRNTCPAE